MSVPHAKTLPKAFNAETAQRVLDFAHQTLQIEADAIIALKNRLTNHPGDSFVQAVAL
jgi:arabinose-5-phosphate isomerase